ncbi:hypothetical protein KUK89_004541 [Vibrio parahaemolyticus]|nr:hypothetical protein [Vibrio parahaemolyticus]
MSTVLWANILLDGVVESDESDKYALYKHSKKLDKISKSLNITCFMSVQDFTDVQFNLSGKDLPDEMESTDELMAINGVWINGAEAVAMLEGLIAHILDKKVNFGLLSNDKDVVVSELRESLVYANKAKNLNGKFNFSVVI